MRKFQLRGLLDEANTAQSKAPDDVAMIVSGCGFKTVNVRPYLSSNKWLWLAGRFLALAEIPFIGWRIDKGSLLFIQFPDAYQGKIGLKLVQWVKRHRHVRIITLMHDVATLRYQDQNEYAEKVPIVEGVMALTDVFIVHNDTMKKWFVSQGISENRVISLGIFDYITPFVPSETSGSVNSRSVVIAGYLALSGSGYLARLKDIAGVDWHLFGVSFDFEKVGGANVHYHGKVAPEALPEKLNYGFGLIWYGDSLTECNGYLGRYSKYINPHKFSLFMAAGLPVIVWKESAMADFVIRNKVGFVVDSLLELSDALEALKPNDYEEYRKNVLKISKKVRDGWYARNALSAAMKVIDSLEVTDQ